MIHSAKWLAMAEMLRGMALPIALLSGSIGLATPLSCLASSTPNWLETENSRDSNRAEPTIQAQFRDPAKRTKTDAKRRQHPLSELNSLAAPSAPTAHPWAVMAALNGAMAATPPVATPSLLVQHSTDSADMEDLENSEEGDSGAMVNGENPPIDREGSLDLSPELIEESPTLQRWLQEVPDLLSDIAHDPSFRTRLRAGFSQFPSTGQTTGFHVGVEDVFVGRTGLTISGDYYQNGNRDRQSYGVDLRYYLLSLGSRLNVAPIVGYRYLKSDPFSTDGVNLGVRLLIVPSRTGAADISLTQNWISPASSEEVGVTTLSFGYAVTHDLRISTDIQIQNSPIGHDSRVGISLEWML